MPEGGPVSISKAYQRASAFGADAVITLPITISGTWVIYGIGFSYDAAPTGGRLTIAGGGFDYTWSITSSGIGFFQIPPGSGVGEKSDMSSPIVITLASAGGVIRGDLTVHATIK
jgi:hypothetical protein